MTILNVSNLSKTYPAFILHDINFSLDEGHIMGLIGKNGAGKSTTIKAILNMVCRDTGEIIMFGKNFFNDEEGCKQSLGVVFGGINFYEYQKLKNITAVTKKFYKNWDDKAYEKYMEMFELDPNKRVNQLSAGMKVKYSIVLALSHHARLFIFDEPTCGLDPVARDDLLEVFRSLVQEGSRSILFSTHITSDLEKCADDITYIQSGKILLSAEKKQFIKSFQNLRTKEDKAELSLEEIMLRSERRNRHDKVII